MDYVFEINTEKLNDDVISDLRILLTTDRKATSLFWTDGKYAYNSGFADIRRQHLLNTNGKPRSAVQLNILFSLRHAPQQWKSTSTITEKLLNAGDSEKANYS